MLKLILAMMMVPFSANAFLTSCGKDAEATILKAAKFTVRVEVVTVREPVGFKMPKITIPGWKGPIPPEILKQFEKYWQENLKRQIEENPFVAIQRQLPRRGQSFGTGFFISKDTIMTNAHVVNSGQNVLGISVKISGSDFPYPVDLIGWDTELDLAILKIKDPEHKKIIARKVGVATFNTDEKVLKLGDPVYALGNPFGIRNFRTKLSVVNKRGYVGSNRMFFLNGSVNPGNSGGPSINCRGEVVAINTAIPSKTGQSAGLAFAIPAMIAKRMAPILKKEKGEFVGSRLGAKIGMIPTHDKSKVVVAGIVDPLGRAVYMGLAKGDEILKINGKPLNGELGFLFSELRQSPLGQMISLTVKRGEETLELQKLFDYL